MNKDTHTWIITEDWKQPKHLPKAVRLIWGTTPGGTGGKESAASAERPVLSLGQEEPLEKTMTTRSSILAWRIPWTEEPSGLKPMGVAKSDSTEQLSTAHGAVHMGLQIEI